MPELPEVETIRRRLERALAGCTIYSATVDDPLCASGCEPGFVEELLASRRITAVRRRGKYLLFDLDPPGTLVIHLRMTGALLLSPEAGGRVRLTLDTSGGPVLFCDTRRLGTVWAGHGDQVHPGVARLGPEPLDPELTAGQLCAPLSRRRASIKASLLDQKLLAGLGNIYADESLWEAGIHPLLLARSLTDTERERLLSAIRTVLTRALDAGGTTFSDYRDPDGERGRFGAELGVYRRHGHPCRKCGEIIERTVVAGRGTHYCPRCQGAKRRFDNRGNS